MGKIFELADSARIDKQLLDAEAAVPCSAGLAVAGKGLYAWWDPSGSLKDFLPADCPSFDWKRSIYVGKSEGPIGARFERNHLGSTRHSSLRRSLAALLYAHLNLLPGITTVGTGKVTMRQDEEDRLTESMLANLRVTWVELAFSPKQLEKAIIRDTSPLLNYTHASRSPYRQSIHGARKDLRAAARLLQDGQPLLRPSLPSQSGNGFV